MRCREVRNLIDEAEKPDLIPYDAARHIDACGECKTFASQRAALRGLLTSSGRVTAPDNFDAMLRARLAERTAPRSRLWLNPALYLQLGVVAVSLLCVFVVAHYFVAGRQPTVNRGIPLARVEQPGEGTPLPSTLPVTPPGPVQDGSASIPALVGGKHRIPIVDKGGEMTASPEYSPAESAYMSVEAAAIVLMRDQRAEREIAIPAISIGAQPVLYVSGRAEQQTSRAGRTSF